MARLVGLSQRRFITVFKQEVGITPKIYRSSWADSLTPGIVSMDCREEGKDCVCSGEGMMQGKKVATRSRSIAPNPAGWTEVTEMSMDGGPFTKMRTFAFNRAK